MGLEYLLSPVAGFLLDGIARIEQARVQSLLPRVIDRVPCGRYLICKYRWKLPGWREFQGVLFGNLLNEKIVEKMPIVERYSLALRNIHC